MLSLFRRGGPAQYVLGAVVALIILAFALEFRQAGSAKVGSLSEKCAVRVGRTCVDRKEFEAAAGLIIPQNLPPSRQKALGIRADVLEGLVERELLLEQARKLGISVGDEVLDEQLLEGRARVSLPVAKARLYGLQIQLGPPFGPEGIRVLPVKSTKTGEFDQRIYERVIRYTANRGPREFREMQRRETTAQRVRDLVRSRVHVSEAEAWESFEASTAKVVVRTVVARRDWFARWTIDSADADVDAWARDHAGEVDEGWKAAHSRFTAGCPLVREILFEADKNAPDETKTEARGKADAALARLQKGASFAAESHRAGGNGDGGEAGCLGEHSGEGHAELAQAVSALKPGQLAPVVETPRGFHVVQLVGRLAARDVEAVGRRHVARGLRLRFLADERARRFAAELLEAARGGQRLDAATEALIARFVTRPGPKGAPPPAFTAEDGPLWLQDEDRPQVEVSAPLTRSVSPLPTAPARERVADKAFALSSPDEVHPAVLETSDGFAVLQLKEKTPATREEFEKQKVRIMRELVAQKGEEALVRYVARLRAAASDRIEVDESLHEVPVGREREE